MSQDALAEKLGSGRSTITKYENGERKIPDARKAKLAIILGCSPWEIMSEDIAPSSRESNVMKYFGMLSDSRKSRLETYLLDLLAAERAEDDKPQE